ncbi:MAG TPA: putative zinc-binding protein [Methanomassiliicoccales archaeon]|nr:putative zinc-binding protein [Methanomassiliicoccales archaeon]
MDNNTECNCSPGELMIFPCAGACNVGQISNDLAKKLSIDGLGKMACIAAVGAGGMMAINAAKATKIVLAIDGCPVGCARKILDKAGVPPTLQVCITDIGMKKTDELVYGLPEFEKARTMTSDRLKTLTR